MQQLESRGLGELVVACDRCFQNTHGVRNLNTPESCLQTRRSCEQIHTERLRRTTGRYPRARHGLGRCQRYIYHENEITNSRPLSVVPDAMLLVLLTSLEFGWMCDSSEIST